MSGAVNIPLDAGDRGMLNLVFKFGTMRQAEQELGKPLANDLASGNVGFDVISAIFWAALQPSLRITREGSDDLVDELGVEKITAIVVEGLGHYFGKADSGEKSGNAKPAKKG